jgi:transketolase
MAAAHYGLDNICVILDNNRLQIDGCVKDIMNIEPVEAKWKAFGWHTIEINGHEFYEIFAALDEANYIKAKPTLVIAHTVKGKGISFFEDKIKYHGIAPTKEELERAIKELGS